MMLRNIPNKYTQSTLLQEIDDMGFVGSYNFFYLPMDVHNRSNVGYAFINFTSPVPAERFLAIFKEHRFRKYQSRKISSVCTAHVQGLDANLRHFENRAVTHARNDQYRPVVLNGSERVDFEEAVAQAKARVATATAPLSPEETQSPPPAVVPAAQAPGPGRAAGGQKAGGAPKSAIAGETAKPRKGSGSSDEQPMANARQGLEAALCEYLMSRQVSEASTAGSSYGGHMAPPPGLGSWGQAGDQMVDPQVADPMAGWGRQSSAPAMMYGGEVGPSVAAVGGDDVNRLLALRGMLVDRLQMRGVAATAGARASSLGSSPVGSSPVGSSPLLTPADGPAYVPLPTILSASKIFQE